MFAHKQKLKLRLKYLNSYYVWLLVQINDKLHSNQTLCHIVHGIWEDPGWGKAHTKYTAHNVHHGTEQNDQAHISSILCSGNGSAIIRQSATDSTPAFRSYLLSSPLYFSLGLLLWKVEATRNSAESKYCHISSIPGTLYGILSVLHLAPRNVEGKRSSFTKESYWMTTDRNYMEADFL